MSSGTHLLSPAQTGLKSVMSQPILPNSHISLPLSKSLCLRILALEFIKGNDPSATFRRLDHGRLCKDIIEFENALEKLWSQLNGDFLHKEITISEGAAPLRFLISIAASMKGISVTINVKGRLAQRPVGSLLECLREMGGSIEQKESSTGYSLTISGNDLRVRDLNIDTTRSSQFLSALILISPLIAGWWRCKLPPVAVSSPYVYMTAKLVEHWREDLLKYMESDWSAAACFYCMAFLFETSTFTLTELHADSLQGDSFISVIARAFGVQTTFEKTHTVISPPGRVPDSEETRLPLWYLDSGTCLSLPMGETPDLVPPLAVALALKGVAYRFYGVEHLRYKESDRIMVLISELRKLGFRLSYEAGCLSWSGERGPREKSVVIDPHGDHRIAMAFAPAERLGLATVSHKEVVEKSFPNFWTQRGVI